MNNTGLINANGLRNPENMTPERISQVFEEIRQAFAVQTGTQPGVIVVSPEIAAKFPNGLPEGVEVMGQREPKRPKLKNKGAGVRDRWGRL